MDIIRLWWMIDPRWFIELFGYGTSVYTRSMVLNHINGQKCDNRIDNLRDIPHSKNCRNRPVGYLNSSGVSGVRWVEEEGKYQVCLVNPETGNLCTYFRTPDFVEAVCHKFAFEQCLKYYMNEWESSAFEYLVDIGIVK